MAIDFKKKLEKAERSARSERKTIVSNGRVMGVPTQDPFEAIPTEMKRRLTLILQGDEKTGKTHLGLTAPEPIALININRGTDGVIQKKEFKGKNIKHIIINLPNQLIASQNEKKAKEEWKKAREAHVYACTSGKYRTVIWDSEDEMWLLARMARWSDLKATPTEYTPVNNEYNAMLNLADEFGVNLILIDKMKDAYKEKTNQNTGKKVGVASGLKKRDGWKHVGYAATEVLETYCDEEDHFSVKVVRSRHRAELNNVIYTKEVMEEEGMELNFVGLACQLIENSTPDEWQ